MEKPPAGPNPLALGVSGTPVTVVPVDEDGRSNGVDPNLYPMAGTWGQRTFGEDMTIATSLNDLVIRIRDSDLQLLWIL